MPEPQDAHAATGRPGRLAQERPPPGSRLEERHLEVVAHEGEDQARGAVAGPHVDEAPGVRERGRGQDVADENPHALRRRAGPGQIDPGAPGGQGVEVGGEAAQRVVPKAERLEGGAVLTRRRREPPARVPPGPAGATVTRRSEPWPTL